MKKKIMAGVTSALGLTLAIVGLNGLTNKGSNVALAKSESFMFNDINLIEHLDEPINGQEGTLTLSVDDASNKYVLTLDNFIYSGAGVTGQVDDNTSCILCAKDVAKDVVVNLIGTNSIIQPSFTGSNASIAYFATDVVFQKDPSLGLSDSASVEVKNLSDDGSKNLIDALHTLGTIDVIDVSLFGFIQSSPSYKSYGIYTEGNFNVTGGLVNAAAGHARVEGDDGCESIGLYLKNGTLNIVDGEVHGGGSEFFGHPNKPGRSVGIHANSILQKGGAVYATIGFLSNYGTGDNIGILCDNYSMDGGILDCRALSSASGDTNYGIKGMNDENSIFTIESASKVHIRARHDSSKVAASGLDIKFAHPTLKGLGFNHDYGMSSWQDDSYTVLEPVAVADAAKLNYMSYWFATVEAEAVKADEVDYDGEPHSAFEGFMIQQPLSTDGTSRMMSRLKGETEFKPGVPKFTDAGTYEIEYYFEIDSSIAENQKCADAYNPTDVRTYTFKILKIDGNITAPTAKQGLKANGQPLELVNAGSSTSGTVVYRLGSEGEFSENIPTAVNAGTYTVQYKALESKNYKETAVGSVEVTIAEGDPAPDPDPTPDPEKDPIYNKDGVKVIVEDDFEVPANVEIRVEVRADVKEKDDQEAYKTILGKLAEDEEIAKVYDVKLIRTVAGVEEEIQPSDLKDGLKFKVYMAIPQGLDTTNLKILHIHSLDDMEFLNSYVVEGNDLVFEISRLSQFAFIKKSGGQPAPVPAKAGLPGGAIAGIIIGAILLTLGIAFLLLFFVFAKFIIVKEKEEEKVVRAIKIGSDKKDDKNYYWMMTFKFRRELKPEEEVFNKKQDAEEFLKNHKGEEEPAPLEVK